MRQIKKNGMLRIVGRHTYVNGLNIETSPGEPGVTPRDITSYSSSTYSINVTSYSTK